MASGESRERMREVLRSFEPGVLGWVDMTHCCAVVANLA